WIDGWVGSMGEWIDGRADVTPGLVITIDGPNAVGKTAAAQALARLLGYRHLNTGAIYRAVAYAALAAELSIRDVGRILEVIEEIRIELDPRTAAVVVNGR